MMTMNILFYTLALSAEVDFRGKIAVKHFDDMRHAIGRSTRIGGPRQTPKRKGNIFRSGRLCI